MQAMQVKHLSMSYENGKEVLTDINFSVNAGELVSILGPSGCGKTTTLRIIAGLQRQTSGNVAIDEQSIDSVPVFKRNMSMVFQNYALFPHLSVFENVAFGLKQRGIGKTAIRKRVAEILSLTELTDLANHRPHALSGGQQQRVSLARALVVNPTLLLLDEPLSNLDRALRLSLREEIRRLQQKLGITALFVTHDQEESFAISDRVIVMNGGHIEQIASAQIVYAHPATTFVAKFIGFENFFNVTRQETSNEYLSGETHLYMAEKTTKPVVRLCIRPENIRLDTSMDTDTQQNSLNGIICDKTYLGRTYRYVVATDHLGQIKVDSEEATHQLGDAVRLTLPSDKLIALAE